MHLRINRKVNDSGYTVVQEGLGIHVDLVLGPLLRAFVSRMPWVTPVLCFKAMKCRAGEALSRQE